MLLGGTKVAEAIKAGARAFPGSHPGVLMNFDSDPNGIVTAPAGTTGVLRSGLKAWVNVDGATSWVEFGGSFGDRRVWEEDLTLYDSQDLTIDGDGPKSVTGGLISTLHCYGTAKATTMALVSGQGLVITHDATTSEMSDVARTCPAVGFTIPTGADPVFPTEGNAAMQAQGPDTVDAFKAMRFTSNVNSRGDNDRVVFAEESFYEPVAITRRRASYLYSLSGDTNDGTELWETGGSRITSPGTGGAYENGFALGLRVPNGLGPIAHSLVGDGDTLEDRNTMWERFEREGGLFQGGVSMMAGPAVYTNSPLLPGVYFLSNVIALVNATGVAGFTLTVSRLKWVTKLGRSGQ